ncbi:unnamed protein product [Arabidopsis halleri]
MKFLIKLYLFIENTFSKKMTVVHLRCKTKHCSHSKFVKIEFINIWCYKCRLVAIGNIKSKLEIWEC